jgi:hypothetical protein
MKAEGCVYKRCGCRDQGTGRRLGAGCLRRERRGHGSWYFAIDLRLVWTGGVAGSVRADSRRGGRPSGPSRICGPRVPPTPARVC